MQIWTKNLEMQSQHRERTGHRGDPFLLSNKAADKIFFLKKFEFPIGGHCRCIGSSKRGRATWRVPRAARCTWSRKMALSSPFPKNFHGQSGQTCKFRAMSNGPEWRIPAGWRSGWWSMLSVWSVKPLLAVGVHKFAQNVCPTQTRITFGPRCKQIKSRNSWANVNQIHYELKSSPTGRT